MELKTAMERLEQLAQWDGIGSRPLSEGLEEALAAVAQGDHAGLAARLISEPALRQAVQELDCLAFRLAAQEGRWELVKALAPYCDIKAGESIALRCAAQAGEWEIVELLLPESDPLAAGSEAFASACANGHERCARLLAPVSGAVFESGAGALLAARFEMALPLIESLGQEGRAGTGSLAARLAQEAGKERLSERLASAARAEAQKSEIEHEVGQGLERAIAARSKSPRRM